MSADATQLRNAIRVWAPRVMRAAAPQMEQAVKRDPQVPRRDRDLERSITASGVTGGDRPRFHLLAPVIQAATTDKGARPHLILPRRPGGVLVFQKGGRTIFARRVNHPGNPARPWWRSVIVRTYPSALRTAAQRTPLG